VFFLLNNKYRFNANRLVFAAFVLIANLYGQTAIKKIKPSDTDPLINTFNSDSHYVYLNASASFKNLLVVHLPGSYGEPKRSTLFGTLASDLGFHSIGLMYPNIPTVGSICAGASDAFCFENVRREIIEGMDYSSNISINSTECVLNRLKKLLMYLNANYPGENWGQYLTTNGELRYPKIIFSGHSQGGGHAALIAKYYPINRALCFSSPKDWSNFFGSPPLWLSSAGWLTLPNNIYCFNHTLDEHAKQLEIWDSLKIDQYGIPVNVDQNTAPYQNSRQLTTSFWVPLGDEHSSTVQDAKTPKISGIPVFIPVWTYMLTSNVSTGLTQNGINRIGVQLISNPTNKGVILELANLNFRIKIFDPSGRLLLDQNAINGQHQINLSDLASGFYYIQVTDGQNIFTKKFIKE
jgi:hypothetical protein